MSFHWEDPVWAAEMRRKIAEAKAAKQSAVEKAASVAQGESAGVRTGMGHPGDAGSSPAAGSNWVDEKADAGPEFRYPDSPERISLRKTTFTIDDPVGITPFGGALKLLRELYKAVQIPSMMGPALGWKCKVCDRPHPAYRQCECPCHAVRAYLEEVDG